MHIKGMQSKYHEGEDGGRCGTGGPEPSSSKETDTSPI